MIADRIVALLGANGDPPHSSVLHGASGNYRFAPLTSDGPLYTVDSAIWCRARVASADLSYLFCPVAEEVEGFLDDLYKWDCCLVALGDYAFSPLGRESVKLLLFPDSSGWKLLGYDVIDAAGLSALTNVGFLPGEVDRIRQEAPMNNQYGLFEDVRRARLFAETASKMAPEHAPFSPVKVLQREVSLNSGSLV